MAEQVALPQELQARLMELAQQRLVFFAGMPGTGKSLLVHLLAHLAHAAGRPVHLLQWDVARPVLEFSPAGLAYPRGADSATHPLVRRATGLWVRDALAAWDAANPRPALLVGEVPLIGNRFTELAEVADDAAEPLLAAADCRFVLAVPSPAVRAHVEAERERRMANPQHAQEREDAPPPVLREVWRDVWRTAAALGHPVAEDAAYDPEAYRLVYANLLARRRLEVLPIDTVLPTAAMSVYDYAFTPTPLVPTPDEVAGYIRLAEAEVGLGPQ